MLCNFVAFVAIAEIFTKKIEMKNAHNANNSTFHINGDMICSSNELPIKRQAYLQWNALFELSYGLNMIMNHLLKTNLMCLFWLLWSSSDKLYWLTTVSLSYTCSRAQINRNIVLFSYQIQNSWIQGLIKANSIAYTSISDNRVTTLPTKITWLPVFFTLYNHRMMKVMASERCILGLKTSLKTVSFVCWPSAVRYDCVKCTILGSDEI